MVIIRVYGPDDGVNKGGFVLLFIKHGWKLLCRARKRRAFKSAAAPI